MHGNFGSVLSFFFFILHMSVIRKGKNCICRFKIKAWTVFVNSAGGELHICKKIKEANIGKEKWIKTEYKTRF